MPNFELDPADAIELAELLQFLANWLTADPEHLTDSLTNYLATPGYDLDQLRNDLNRFTFLLGGNDGEHLFAP
jgi:hypothetical protein